MLESSFSDCTSLDAFLKKWRELGEDVSDLRAIVGGLLQKDRAWQVAHASDVLPNEERQLLASGFERRREGEPVAYIVGYREFFGLQFQVSPSVLIPRPETELLVELALRALPLGAKVLDVGTGSGAIALALAHVRADLEVWACDISEAALGVALSNAKRLGLEGVRFFHSNLLGEAEKGFHAIVSNPPYIASGDSHLREGDLRFEPRLALSDDGNGLRLISRLINEAPARLLSGGFLAIEHGYAQGPSVQALFKATDRYMNVETTKDLAGLDRVTCGKLSA